MSNIIGEKQFYIINVFIINNKAKSMFSSSTQEGADITSSGQTEAALISSTANGPALLHSFSVLPQQQQANELVNYNIKKDFNQM